MSSVFTSLAAYSIMGLEVSAANIVINGFGQMPTQVRKETKRQSCWKQTRRRHTQGAVWGCRWLAYSQVIFFFFFCCNNWRNCVLGLNCTDGWRPSSSRLALTLNCCIKMAKWKYFHLSIPIKLNHFQRRNTGRPCCAEGHHSFKGRRRF